MKTCRSLLFTLTLSICVNTLFAQTQASHTDSLMRSGIALTDAGKFTEAIAKYDEVLRAMPGAKPVLYEKATTLTAMGKYDDAIAIFEKLLADTKTPNIYAGIGDAYDMKGDYQTASNYYLKGIAQWPKDRNLWFNLSVCYTRQKKYPQAQGAAAEAIKADPRHFTSYRNYAIAAYLQGRNAEALLGLSNYLVFPMPPNQSAGACQILRQILRASPKPDVEPIAKLQQETIANAVGAATVGKENLKPIDSLNLQLTAVYKAIKAQEDQYGSPFFSKYFGNYFGDIATSNYMDVFTHVVAISLSPQENLAWLKGRLDDVKSFNQWLASQKRVME
jgi:Tfp pilus assembly protein PilF